MPSSSLISRSRSVIAASVLALTTAILTPALPATAAPSWEVNYASRVAPVTHLCSYEVEATYGGNSINPHYSGCFVVKGDHVVAWDDRADGRAAVTKWEYKASRGSSVTRRGICIYTGGSAAGKGKGTCNKDLPENGLLRFSAGVRVKATTKLADMKFGGAVCMGLRGDSGSIGDANCLLW